MLFEFLTEPGVSEIIVTADNKIYKDIDDFTDSNNDITSSTAPTAEETFRFLCVWRRSPRSHSTFWAGGNLCPDLLEETRAVTQRPGSTADSMAGSSVIGRSP